MLNSLVGKRFTQHFTSNSESANQVDGSTCRLQNGSTQLARVLIKHCQIYSIWLNVRWNTTIHLKCNSLFFDFLLCYTLNSPLKEDSWVHKCPKNTVDVLDQAFEMSVAAMPTLVGLYYNIVNRQV